MILEVASVFEAKVGGKFAALNLLEDDIDTLKTALKRCFMSQEWKSLANPGGRTSCGSPMRFLTCVTNDGS